MSRPLDLELLRACDTATLQRMYAGVLDTIKNAEHSHTPLDVDYASRLRDALHLELSERGKLPCVDVNEQ